jgi:hypothetical protein
MNVPVGGKMQTPDGNDASARTINELNIKIALLQK